MQLLIEDLVRLTGGRLRMASMPPKDGVLTPVGRIVLTAGETEPGDVFWNITGRPGDAEWAFLRGAAGVVTDAVTLEPRPGCFCVQVAAAADALVCLVSGLNAASLDCSQRYARAC
jgi:hypothetical protein